MKDLITKFNVCTKTIYNHTEKDGSWAVIREGNRLTILFEKSRGKNDWINNFRFFAIPTKPYKNMTEGIWFCHRGFDKVWKSVEPFIAKAIFETSITNVDIIGYSHGGALAQLCYEYIKFNRPDIEVSGVGFGAPRVLWGFARKSVKERFKGFKVIRNGNDVVTHLPPVLFGFRHVGEVVKVGKAWGYKDFKKSVEEKGLKAALRKCDHIGVVKDHTPKRYREALEEVANAEIY